MTVIQALAFGCGLSSHLLVFSKGEWDRHAPKVVLANVLLCIVVFTVIALFADHSIAGCFVETSKFDFAFIGGLVTSLLTYRFLLHPLRTFPGPRAARISSFWAFREQWPDLRFYIRLQSVHNEYGDFVRIKPRELSICHPDAINDVHGPKSGIRKGEFYEQIHPAQSLQFTRDPIQHKRHRRYWDKAFQTKALKEYSPRIVKHYSILMDIFSEHAASAAPVDVSKHLMDLFFDVISDLTFGESFNTLTTGERNPIIGEFLQYQKSVGFAILNMWMLHLLRSIPLVASRILYMMQWYSSAISKREEVRERSYRKRQWYKNALRRRELMKHISPDLYTHLSQSETFEVDGMHEAQLAIIAGADTNAITVSNTCYLLCRYPDYQEKLYEELRHLPVTSDILDDQFLVGKPCLLGIINETMRLYPPVPGGLQRLTPPKGATIAGRYVPGNMVVTTPTYALHRGIAALMCHTGTLTVADPRAFVRPDEFIPERWTSRPELVLRKDAFVPFSYGTYNCAGKPLAMMQLRMVVAMLIKKFRLSFAPGKEEECGRYIEDQADCFTLHIHSLPLLLEERNARE